MLTIEIPGEPVAQGRPRFARHGAHMVAYDPAKSRDWKATAQHHMILALRDGRLPRPCFPDGACRVHIVAVFTCPKSDHRKARPTQRRPHTKRPDAENVAKAVLDAGSGVLWRDDAQVDQLIVEKVIGAQGEPPCVLVEVQ